ncbi:hypothetical protein [Nocardia jejuensis]|uniref:hypothetical protein n=1 Tax=Nocardia jejuensis TaxID=328049 RepID=UPI001FDF87B0|nr:hypothetical protein [Nocardia jejuensis]
MSALSLAAVLSTVALIPAAAPARAESETLAAVQVADSAGVCGTGTASFDDIVTGAATAVRTVVPPVQQAAFDQQVNDFRQTIAQVRVHRQGLPVDPAGPGGRLQFLDDPIVTYLVNTLDSIRTGQIDKTLSLSRVTVADVIEVFILGTRIVKIPAQFAASLVPTVGFVLKPIVGALFNGVKSLARTVQASLARNCNGPNAYEKLQLEFPDEHVEIPQPLLDLANQLARADGACTPIAELKTSDLVERTRDFLTRTAGLPVDPAAVDGNAAALQGFLRDNRVAEIVTLRRIEELGPLVNAMDYGPLTFLANLGFDIYEGKALNTVPLGDVKVENAFDLITLTLDTASLLMTVGTTVAGFSGVGQSVTIPLGIAQTLAFAPTTYGMPILRGVMQSMCAAA